MGDIQQLQQEHAAWVNYNFPNQPNHQPLLGIMEEVGELAHAHLKDEQGIRGEGEKLMALAKDALGDMFVFMMSYCNAVGFDLEECINTTWDQVKRRDWQRHPETGGEILGEGERRH